MNRTVRKWERAVDYACQHALHVAGYDEPKSIRQAKVADLLRIPEVDANNVASMLSFLYGEDNRWRKAINHGPNFNISREELLADVRAICEFYDYDQHPEWLADISVSDFLLLEGIDEVTIPPMVRKIKHILNGTDEPTEAGTASVSLREEKQPLHEEDRGVLLCYDSDDSEGLDECFDSTGSDGYDDEAYP